MITGQSEWHKNVNFFPNATSYMPAFATRRANKLLKWSMQPQVKTVNSTTKLSKNQLKRLTNVMYNEQHYLQPTLPGTMDTKYHLRPRPHNFKLISKNRSIAERDIITRMLFKDVYWYYALFTAVLCIYIPFIYVSSFIHRYFIRCLASCRPN